MTELRRARITVSGPALIRSGCSLSSWRLAPVDAAGGAAIKAPQKATFVAQRRPHRLRCRATARVAALVTIEHGWHVNSHKPTFEYLIPTVLDLTLPAGWPAGDGPLPGGEDADVLLRAASRSRSTTATWRSLAALQVPKGVARGTYPRPAPPCATRPATIRSACRR